MFEERLARVLGAMKERGLEQMIVADPASVYYLTGRMILPGERMLALYLHTGGNHRLVLSKLFPQSGDVGVELTYFDDVEDCVEILAQYIEKDKKVGVDKIWPAKFLLRLMELGAGSAFVNGSPVIDEIRQIKDAEEIEKMREASRLNDAAVERLIPLVGKGLTEQQLADELLKIYLELGAEGFSFEPICGYGANAADPHHITDSVTVGKTGDSVVLDIGCVKDGYCSDMTRTVFLGGVSDKAKEVYETVLEANRRAIAVVKPGVRFCDVDRAARDYIAGKGYGPYFTHRTGHCIGQEVHECGDVSSINEAVLKPGMIFSIEPGIYLAGEVGVRIEDLVLVTEDGCEVLNRADKELTVVK